MWESFGVVDAIYCCLFQLSEELLFFLGTNAVWWKAVQLTRGAAVVFSTTVVLSPSRGCGGDAAATRLEADKKTSPNTRPSEARCPHFDSVPCHCWYWARLPYLAKYWSKRAKGIGRARPSFTKNNTVNFPKALQTKRVLTGVVVQNKKKPLLTFTLVWKMPPSLIVLMPHFEPPSRCTSRRAIYTGLSKVSG